MRQQVSVTAEVTHDIDVEQLLQPVKEAEIINYITEENLAVFPRPAPARTEAQMKMEADHEVIQVELSASTESAKVIINEPIEHIQSVAAKEGNHFRVLTPKTVKAQIVEYGEKEAELPLIQGQLTNERASTFEEDQEVDMHSITEAWNITFMEQRPLDTIFPVPLTDIEIEPEIIPTESSGDNSQAFIKALETESTGAVPVEKAVLLSTLRFELLRRIEQTEIESATESIELGTTTNAKVVEQTEAVIAVLGVENPEAAMHATQVFEILTAQADHIARLLESPYSTEEIENIEKEMIIWATQLLEYIGVKTDEETARKLVELIIIEARQALENNDLELARDRGTHETKLRYIYPSDDWHHEPDNDQVGFLARLGYAAIQFSGKLLAA